MLTLNLYQNKNWKKIDVDVAVQSYIKRCCKYREKILYFKKYESLGKNEYEKNCWKMESILICINCKIFKLEQKEAK